MQLSKNIKIFINYFLGPLLFVWLSFFIFRQVSHQSQLEASWLRIRNSFQSYKIAYLAGAVLLIPINWGLEALKWKISLNHVHRISFSTALKAVLTGVSFSVTTPNRMGEYVGRVMYLPEGNRLKTVSITLVGSFAQLLVTIMAGTLGLIILKNTLLEHFINFRIWWQFIVYGLLVLVLILVAIYLHVPGGIGLFKKWIRNERYIYLVAGLKYFTQPLLLHLLFLSLLRYAVFILQYIFIFYLFEVNVAASLLFLVMSVVFLAMAIIPSIALLEVWLRGEIMIVLMGMYTTNTLGIGFTSVIMWFLNLILPAIIGSLLLLNMRVFNKKNETV